MGYNRFEREVQKENNQWESIHIITSDKMPEWLLEMFIEWDYIEESMEEDFKAGEYFIAMATKGDGIAYDFAKHIKDFGVSEWDYGMDNKQEIKSELMVSESTAQTLNAFGIMNI